MVGQANMNDDRTLSLSLSLSITHTHTWAVDLVRQAMLILVGFYFLFVGSEGRRGSRGGGTSWWLIRFVLVVRLEWLAVVSMDRVVQPHNSIQSHDEERPILMIHGGFF